MEKKPVRKRKRLAVWVGFLCTLLVGLVIGERTTTVLASYPVIMWVRITQVIVGLILIDDLFELAIGRPTASEVEKPKPSLRVARVLHKAYRWGIYVVAALDILILAILVGCELAR
jgi:hypothetical protein